MSAFPTPPVATVLEQRSSEVCLRSPSFDTTVHGSMRTSPCPRIFHAMKPQLTLHSPHLEPSDAVQAGSGAGAGQAVAEEVGGALRIPVADVPDAAGRGAGPAAAGSTPSAAQRRRDLHLQREGQQRRLRRVHRQQRGPVESDVESGNSCAALKQHPTPQQHRRRSGCRRHPFRKHLGLQSSRQQQRRCGCEWCYHSKVVLGMKCC